MVWKEKKHLIVINIIYLYNKYDVHFGFSSKVININLDYLLFELI